MDDHQDETYRRVDLHLPADLSQLFLVRLVAEAVALAADFPLDYVADTKLATDQAATSLLQNATPGARLRCRFRTYPDHVQVSLSIDGDVGTDALTQGVGWRMLTAVARSLSVSIQPRAPAERQVTVVEFVLRPAR